MTVLVGDREVRKISITGGGMTNFITLPKWMTEHLGWGQGTEIEIELKVDKVILKEYED